MVEGGRHDFWKERVVKEVFILTSPRRGGRSRKPAEVYAHALDSEILDKQLGIPGLPANPFAEKGDQRHRKSAAPVYAWKEPPRQEVARPPYRVDQGPPVDPAIADMAAAALLWRPGTTQRQTQSSRNPQGDDQLNGRPGIGAVSARPPGRAATRTRNAVGAGRKDGPHTPSAASFPFGAQEQTSSLLAAPPNAIWDSSQNTFGARPPQSPRIRSRPVRDHKGQLVHSMDTNGPFSMTW